MTGPIIVKLKPQKLTVKALKSNGKYKNIKGLFKGMMIIYPKISGDITTLTITINGQLIGADKPWEMAEELEDLK